MNCYLKFIPIHGRHPMIRCQIWMNLPKNGVFEDINHKWWSENTIHMSRKTPGGGVVEGSVIYEIPPEIIFNPPHTNTTRKVDKFKSWTSDDPTLLLINFRNLFVVRIFMDFSASVRILSWCANFQKYCWCANSYTSVRKKKHSIIYFFSEHWCTKSHTRQSCEIFALHAKIRQSTISLKTTKNSQLEAITTCVRS